MGWLFGKKKVPIAEVVQDLVMSVFAGVNDQSLSLLVEALGVQPSEEQKREWLILNMLSVSRAVTETLDSKAKTKALLDRVHAEVVSAVCCTESTADEFEKLVEERYQEYSAALQQSPTAFGGSFSKHLVSVPEAGVMMLASSYFYRKLEATRKFAAALNQFDLVE